MLACVIYLSCLGEGKSETLRPAQGVFLKFSALTSGEVNKLLQISETNFSAPHRIKGNRAIPPVPLPFLLHGNALRSRSSIQGVSAGGG